ncbi:MAG: hypothetical protein ABIQ16_05920 [Polyangiaceae bacterium]
MNADTGRPLSGVRVEIWSIHEGKTDAKGVWTSKVFPSGTYDLKVFLAGFGPVPATGVARQEFTFIQATTFPRITGALPLVLITVQLAQALPRAVVTVIDPNNGNAVVNGADVEINGTTLGKTDATGVFTTPPIALGTSQMKVRKPFYGPPSPTGAAVTEADAQLTLNLANTVDTPFTVPIVNTIGKVISSNITVNGKPFVTWFNTDFRSRMPKTHPTVQIGGRPAPVFPSTIGAAPFKDAYDNCSRILAPQMSIEEFIATFCIIYNESGGTFKPVSEVGTPKYFFEPDAKRHKASYNSGGNKKAGDQLLAQGAISTPADVTAWNSTVWPNPPAGSTLEAAALECDFNKYRGRGFIQITFRTNFLKHVAPALRAAGNAKPGQTDEQMLDSMTDATLGSVILSDPNVFYPMTKSYFLTVKPKLDQVNQRVWKPFALSIAGNNPPYAELFDFRCNNLLTEMKKDGVVLA